MSFPACWSASLPGWSQYRSSPMVPGDQSCERAVAAVLKTLYANSLVFSVQDSPNRSLHLLLDVSLAVRMALPRRQLMRASGEADHPPRPASGHLATSGCGRTPEYLWRFAWVACRCFLPAFPDWPHRPPSRRLATRPS